VVVAELLRFVDLWGREIILHDDNWKDHILVDHAIMDGYEAYIEDVLADPDLVTRDADNTNGVNYYRANALPPPDDQQYLKVCVRFRPSTASGQQIGILVTTYPTVGVKRSEKITWSRRTS
jgi:hypothetical protein